MPDLQNFRLTPLADGNVNVTRTTAQVQVTDSKTGAVLFDRTGANTFQIAFRVSGLSIAQNRRLVDDHIAPLVIRMLAGLEP